jgi:hypothetical protein
VETTYRLAACSSLVRARDLTFFTVPTVTPNFSAMAACGYLSSESPQLFAEREFLQVKVILTRFDL